MFVSFWAICENGFTFHGNMEVEDTPVRGMKDIEYIELYVKAHLIEACMDVSSVTVTSWKRWDA